MVAGLEKILKHFINGKEYSPGLIVNIISVESDMYDNVRVVFDVDNVGDVPYNLLIVGVNLRSEVEKLSEYISFEPNHIYVSYVGQKKGIQDVFHIQGSEVPFSEIFYLTKSFKSELLHNLQDITQLPVDYHHGKKEHLKIFGKFIPRIGVSDFRDELFLDLTFRVKDTEPKIEYDLQQLEGDVDEELIQEGFPEYKRIREALSETFDKWPRNFYFDDSGIDLPYWMEEVFRVSISLV
jgi:hypothetical protein